MSEIRDKCTFYSSHYKAIKTLKNKERLALYDAIFAYQFDGELLELSGTPQVLFEVFKPTIDFNNARKSKYKTNDNLQTICQQNKSSRVKSYELNDKDKKENIKEKRFIPPSVEEVDAYCKERNNDIDAQYFVDFYSSKGWVVGKNKMKDWKASVRTWERNNQKSNVKSEVKDIVPDYRYENKLSYDQNEVDEYFRRLHES